MRRLRHIIFVLGTFLVLDYFIVMITFVCVRCMARCVRIEQHVSWFGHFDLVIGLICFNGWIQLISAILQLIMIYLIYIVRWFGLLLENDRQFFVFGRLLNWWVICCTDLGISLIRIMLAALGISSINIMLDINWICASLTHILSINRLKIILVKNNLII